MVAVQLRLELPDALAREAENSHLLSSAAIEELLRSELRRRRIADLLVTADRLALGDEPPLSPGDIEAEIQAVRAERRSAGAGRR